MSHFYATIQGHCGEATRMGTARSGMYSNTAGWKGCISVHLWESSRAEHDDCPDRYTVSLVPWHGSGGLSRVIAEGPLDARATEIITRGAAPELLKALERLRDLPRFKNGMVFDPMPEVLLKARDVDPIIRAAIAKAKDTGL